MRRPGWTELGAGSHDRYWTRFEQLFDFRAVTAPPGWPAIREPTPSLTIDLSPIFARSGPEFIEGQAAVNGEVARAFTSCLPDRRRLIVLDWQHPAYLFEPSSSGSADIAAWPVQPFPNGDYYAFLSEDFSEGTFGHPWEQSLCVMGARLVGSLGGALRTWLPVLRVDGNPAA